MTCVCRIKHDSKDCKSDKGLQVFYDEKTKTYTGYCFSCAARGKDAYVKNPFDGDTPPDPPKKKTKEEVEAEIAEIRALQIPDFEYRGIPPEYFKRAGIRLALSEYDGKTAFSMNMPLSRSSKLIGYEVRAIPFKGIWRVGESDNIRDCDLFNWEVAKKKGVKRLYITEGVYDCLSLQYMLEKWSGKGYDFAVTSVPNGAESASRTIGNMREEILKYFKEVVLVFDNDEAGEKAIANVQKVFPEVMTVPHIAGVKDANDALLKGQMDTFCDFVKWKSRKPTPKGVRTVQQILQDGDSKPEMGYSYPWATLTEITYGKRMGECTCIGGGVGGGKTTLVHEDVRHNIFQHKVPCSVFLLEEDNKKTIRNVAAKQDGIGYNKPEVYEANEDRFLETAKSLEDKLFVWNSSSNREYRFNLDNIISAVRFNTVEYGCLFHYIDNMTKLVDHLNATEANEYINKYSSELDSLAAELGIHIFLLSHLNPPKGRGAISHEEGGDAYPGQLTGSRGIMRSFSNIIMFERNKFAEGDKQNNSFLAVRKNRDYGGERKVKTRYDPITTRVSEYDWAGETLYEEE